MRIAIMGSGGIGGYYGAHLAAAGADIAFIARGAHLTAIRRHGLRLTGPRGDLHIDPARAGADPAALGPVDAVLFCVKLYDTEAAAELIRPIVGPDTMVISLMNGVDGPERIGAVVGADRVLGGAAYVSALIAEPGVIRYASDMNALVFGEMDGRSGERAERFLAACRPAAFDSRLSDDIDRDLWAKFVLLATNAGLTSIVRKPAGEIYTDPDLKALAADLMREVAAVAAAKGVRLPADVVERSVALTETFPPGMYASMYHDLDRGRRMELAGLSGLVARLGGELGVPTPCHRTIYACLKPYMNGGG